MIMNVMQEKYVEKEYFERLRELGDLFRSELLTYEQYQQKKEELKKKYHM